MGRSCLVLVVIALVVVGVVGCGGGKLAPSPSALSLAVAGMQKRLVAEGYTVRHDVAVVPVARHLLPQRAFSVYNVDWTAPYTFSVAIYVLGSRNQAQRFAAKLDRWFGLSTRRFPSTEGEYRIRAAARIVYLAFTSMSPNLCGYAGLCGGYQQFGPLPICSAGGGCSGGPTPLPLAVFDGFISRAQRAARSIHGQDRTFG